MPFSLSGSLAGWLGKNVSLSSETTFNLAEVAAAAAAAAAAASSALATTVLYNDYT